MILYAVLFAICLIDIVRLRTFFVSNNNFLMSERASSQRFFNCSKEHHRWAWEDYQISQSWIVATNLCCCSKLLGSKSRNTNPRNDDDDEGTQNFLSLLQNCSSNYNFPQPAAATLLPFKTSKGFTNIDLLLLVYKMNNHVLVCVHNFIVIVINFI